MREVPDYAWEDFCRRINERERTAVTTIEFTDRSGFTRQIARNVPFGTIHFGPKDACSQRMMIHARENGGAKHEIIEPFHVFLRETEGGAAFNAVAIEAEEGTTFVTFHPVIRLEWLEGLELQTR